MKVIIMGCGRLGSTLAGLLDEGGHEVTMLDTSRSAFRRLPEEFGGVRVVGNGMDMDSLELAGIAQADAFVAVTQGDNRNYFASQLAREVYSIRRVLCRVYDPARSEIFRDLGIETYSPTRRGSERMAEMLLTEDAG